jgi:hypothetical protein
MNKNDVQLLENIINEVGKCSCGKKKKSDRWSIFYTLFYFIYPIQFFSVVLKTLHKDMQLKISLPQFL